MKSGTATAQQPSLPSTWARIHAFLRSPPWLILSLYVLFFLVSAFAVVLYASGRLPLTNALLISVTPPILVAAALRPSLLVLALLAIPPGLLASTRFRPLALLLAAILIAQALTRGRLFLGPQSGLYPLALLAFASLIFSADAGADAAIAASNFLKQFSYYLLLGLLSYNLARLGELRLGHLVLALLVGVLLTALLKLAIGGIGPVPHAVDDAASGLFFGRNYAYLTFVGFSICFAGSILGSQGPNEYTRYRPWLIALTVFFLILTAPSLVRGSWLLAGLTVLVVGWVTGKRIYMLLIPLAVVIAFAVPAASGRLTTEQPGGTGFTTGRAELWSTVWEDHASEGLPWGNGFGYAWSLTPDRLFGFEQFVLEGENQAEFVYLHSDLLFWLVEYGFLGLAAMAIFWGHVLHTWGQMYRHPDPYVRSSAILLTGIVIAMLGITIFGNAMFFRPLAERGFVAIGFLFGVRAAANGGRLGTTASGMTPSRHLASTLPSTLET